MTLDEARKQASEEWRTEEAGRDPLLLVGTATCGRAAGSLDVLDVLRTEIRRRGITCIIRETGCIGLCSAEPIVCIAKPSRPTICYGSVTPERSIELIERYLINDDPAQEYALGTIGEGDVDGIPPLFETPFFKPQVRRTLENCGLIDPNSINHYFARNGYTGFEKALAIGQDKVIEEIRLSNLRGRGGAGFPVWKKWQFCREAQADEKYVICNGSEGDPGCFSNKLLFESDPHSVLEGMMIAAFAVDARKGYVYCPSDYPLAEERLRTAIDTMREHGLLGEKILGSTFGFDITVKQGAGAYICGEETALIECIEGKRGIPRFRPPFPPVSGLWNKPTVIQNVETLACVTRIIRNGADRFVETGTENSRGTKTFSLSGALQRSGVIEVPLGITLDEIVTAIGGGAGNGSEIKAIFIGGPGGGCVPPNLLHVPVDHDSLREFGSSMGSGGIVAVDESTCMVDIALNFLDFVQRENCGTCVPCRLGVKKMYEIVRNITGGRGRPEDIDLLVELGEAMKAGSFCGLGQAAPNPVLSTIRYFRDEYREHIDGSKCRAGVCKFETAHMTGIPNQR